MRSIGALAWITVALACGSPARTAAPSNRASVADREGVQYVGDPHASVVINYYFDYECPHCVTFSPMIDELERKYGSRIVVHYKNFQLARHPDARTAAIAVEAARRQGKFIEMHRLLMEHAASWQDPDRRMFSPEALRDLAAKLGLDLARYDADIKDASAGARVDGEYAEGEQHGLSFVPAVFFGTQLYEGPMAVAELSSAIDTRLR